MTDRYSRHPGRAGYTRVELIEMIRSFMVSCGRMPTTRDADSGTGGLASAKAFTREFGSMREAVMAAGGNPTQPEQKSAPGTVTGVRGYL